MKKLVFLAMVFSLSGCAVLNKPLIAHSEVLAFQSEPFPKGTVTAHTGMFFFSRAETEQRLLDERLATIRDGELCAGKTFSKTERWVKDHGKVYDWECK